MKFNEFPFLRYAFFFISGVLLYPWSGPLLKGTILFWLVLSYVFYLALVFFNLRKKYPVFKVLIPSFAYLILFLMGQFFSFQKDLSHHADHLINSGKVEAYLAKVLEHDQPKPNSTGNAVEVLAVKKGKDTQPAKGKVLIYHRSEEPLLPGSLILVKGHPGRLEEPSNPAAFNYASFMAKKQVYFSHFIGNDFEILPTKTKSDWSLKINDLRAFLEEKIEVYIQTPASAQIAKALLIGQKEDLETGLSEAYVTAGAMHVLAVSGLHVGIIYGFFFLFWKPHRSKGFVRVLLLGFIVMVIWLYALITGMSPSVMRAATMFSLMAIAQMKFRNPSIFNPLALSAMVLVMFDPFIVFSVGFQLSYIALTGILLFQPLISRIWIPNQRWLQYFWEITAVGLAAQLATFPLSIHYFHVFPTYFLFSNLFAIPGAFLVMAAGIPFLLLSTFDGLGFLLGQVVDFIVNCLNNSVFTLQYLPFSRLENLHFQLPEMLLIWTFLFFLYFLIEDRAKIQFTVILVVMFLFSFYRIGWFWKNFQKEELLVYAVEEGLAVDYFSKGQVYSFTDDVKDNDLKYAVLPFRIQSRATRNRPLLGEIGNKGYQLILPDGLSVFFGDDLDLLDHERFLVWVYDGGAWRDFDPTQHANNRGMARKIIF